MSYPESHHDLLRGVTFPALATNSPDGYPQVTAVAFLWDDDGDVKISLNETRQKTKNLRRDPRATLYLIDPEDPMRYLEIRADAELTPDEGKVFAAKAGAKYDSDFTVHDGPGEERVVVTLRPTRVRAVNMRG
jgi:PPOX class probable F420-dependent enzyme